MVTCLGYMISQFTLLLLLFIMFDMIYLTRCTCMFSVDSSVCLVLCMQTTDINSTTSLRCLDQM